MGCRSGLMSRIDWRAGRRTGEMPGRAASIEPISADPCQSARLRPRRQARSVPLAFWCCIGHDVYLKSRAAGAHAGYGYWTSEESEWARRKPRLAVPTLFLARRTPCIRRLRARHEPSSRVHSGAFSLHFACICSETRAFAFPVIASEAKQSRSLHPSGLPRRCAPRKDGGGALLEIRVRVLALDRAQLPLWTSSSLQACGDRGLLAQRLWG
jgi:hypothetical protein